MDRFDPCGTDECKKRCDSYGVACDDIMADEIERLRAELAAARTVKESLIVALDLLGRHSPKGKPCPVCEAIDAAMAGGA